MAYDVGPGGGSTKTRDYDERYPDMAEGRPEKGWDPNNYGYSDNFVIVPYGKHIDLEAQGLQIYDVISEDDNEVYYVMGAPSEETKESVSYYEKLEAELMNWDIDIDSVDWGSIVPGLDVMKDTLDVEGLTASVERKGRMIKVTFQVGGRETIQCYDFGSNKQCDDFLSNLSAETGIDFYTTEGY